MPRLIALPGEQLAFCLMGKVANTSVKNAVLSSLGRPERFAPEQGVLPWHALQFLKSTEGYRVLAMVRHPLDRLVSAWADPLLMRTILCRIPGITPDMGFAAFARRVVALPDRGLDHHLRSQTALLRGLTVRAADIGRLEDMPVTWCKFQEIVMQHGGRLADLQRHHVGHREPWRKFYDTDLRRLVERRYDEDIARWYGNES